jgi:DNA repair exonuclease SbcCD nuclease subunit
MTKKKQHIILGDVHLGRSISIGKPGVGKELNSRVQDQLNLLDWTLDYASQHQIDHIVMTGDVYQEPRPHPALINYFMSWLKKCEAHGVRVDIVAGNHDIMRSGNYSLSALDLIPAVELPHAHVHKDPTVQELGGVRFAFVPYRDRRMYEADDVDAALKALKEELADVLDIQSLNPTVSVVVGHLSLAGSLNITDEISDELNEIFVPHDVFDGWDFTFMGHIHHPQDLVEEFGCYVGHVGSMDRSDFGANEVNIDKYIVVLDGEGNGAFKKVPLPTRYLRKIEVEVPHGKDSTDFVNNAICLYNKKNPIADAIVKLEITLAGEDIENVDRDKVTAYVCDKLGAQHICSFSETRNLSVVNIDKDKVLDKEMGIPETIAKFADVRDDFEDKEEKLAFKVLALDCNREYEERLGK